MSVGRQNCKINTYNLQKFRFHRYIFNEQQGLIEKFISDAKHV